MTYLTKYLTSSLADTLFLLELKLLRLVLVASLAVGTAIKLNPMEEERFHTADPAVRNLSFEKVSHGDSRVFTPEQIDRLIALSWWAKESLTVRLAVRKIIHCESSFNPFAVNDNGPKGLDVGLMQINMKAHKNLLTYSGVDQRRLTDPLTNLQIGYAVYFFAKKTFEPWRSSNGCHNLLQAKNIEKPKQEPKQEKQRIIRGKGPEVKVVLKKN